MGQYPCLIPLRSAEEGFFVFVRRRIVRAFPDAVLSLDALLILSLFYSTIFLSDSNLGYML
jgi:hypothetical protein